MPNVWVRTMGETDDRAVTRDRHRGIHSYFWAPNSEQILYIQDRDGDENWHVYAVPAAGGDARDLTPRAGVQARVEAVTPEHPDEILVSMNDRDPQFHDVYRVNLRTGALTLEAKNDLGAVSWTADHQLRVRIAAVPTPGGGMKVFHRAKPEADWQELISYGIEDMLTTEAIGFAADNRTLYLRSSVGSNTTELRAMDVTKRKEKVLAADPTADVSDVLLHPTSHRVQAVAFERARHEWQPLDSFVRMDLMALARLHYGDFFVMSRDDQDRTWLVAYIQDKGPVLYYAWDRQQQKGTFLFSHRPALGELELAEMKPVTFPARDGLTLHGYLTLPAGAEPRGLPAVLNVRGGPWDRDSWGYSGEAQWLANRGYACLQVNFRGSTGYGKEFLNAGDHEWGGKMQDDLSDAVAWLVGQGIADPTRTAIYGGSYGGYATLCGLSMTPELYRCGVAVVGPSNLITFIQIIPPYWEAYKALFARRVGDVETEQEFLKSRSPLFHVDRIRAPLLLVQGANDPRVKREESVQIRDALRAAGKEIVYLEFADEGHGFARPENRLRFYAVAERFPAQHLGGRYEPEKETGTGGGPGAEGAAPCGPGAP